MAPQISPPAAPAHPRWLRVSLFVLLAILLVTTAL